MAEPWRARSDPQELELVVGNRRPERRVEHLPGRPAIVGRRNSVTRAEYDYGVVLLGLDLALRSEARADERCLQTTAQSRLREEEEVVDAAPEHDERGADAR